MDQEMTETRPWDVVEHLETEKEMAAYLDAALEDGDMAVVMAALGDIARAKGMTQIAEKASAIATEEYLEERARRGSREKFLAAMGKVADLQPSDERDRI